MKKSKLIIGFILVALLTGCGKKNTEQEANNDNRKQVETTEGIEMETPDSQEAENSQDQNGENTPIEEQTFAVNLDGWGDVTFTSLQPASEEEDVQFRLVKEGRVVDDLTEGASIQTGERFDKVLAVAFDDYNKDEKKDILIIIQYTQLDSGKSYNTVKVYTQKDNEKTFSADEQLEEYLAKNYYTDTIEAVREGILTYNDYEASMDGSRSVGHQLELIVDAKDQWISTMDYANEVYSYAVTDLDRNGRLEVIASNTGGTGIYTYSDYYEVNDTYDGLTKCEQNYQEGDSQADIAIKNTVAYYDESTVTTYYIFFDYLRINAAESYETLHSISLQDGKIVDQILASTHTTYTDTDCTESYEKADGTTINQEDYTRIPDTVYANLMKSDIAIGWFEVGSSEELSKMSDEKLMEQLDNSYTVWGESLE